jgi:hypothetical protein
MSKETRHCVPFWASLIQSPPSLSSISIQTPHLISYSRHHVDIYWMVQTMKLCIMKFWWISCPVGPVWNVAFFTVQNSGRWTKSRNPAIILLFVLSLSLVLIASVSKTSTYSTHLHQGEESSFRPVLKNKYNANLVRCTNKQTNSMVWVRKRIISTERPPLVGEVIANFCG